MFFLICWTVLYYFHSIQAFIESSQVLAASGVLEDASNQILTRNDTKLQEFADIFNHYINLTLLENESRKELSRITTEVTRDDEKQDLNVTQAWQTALNEALDEENITKEFNKPLNDEVIEYIPTYASNPENLKAFYELYEQRLESDRTQTNLTEYSYDHDLNTDNITDTDEAEAVGNDTATEYDAFWDDTPTRRIYRGKPTKIKLYPFIVSVLMFNTFACAGSIIKNDLVITAASCLQIAHNNRFFRENPLFVSVRVGSLYFSVGGEIVQVTEIFFHPIYNPKTLRNNLAVMRLRKVLNFKHRNVKKIDFDRNAANLPENTPPITILGWGAKTHSNKLSFRGRLHVTELDYYDRHSCREVYGEKFVTQTHFCAGFISRGEGACNHDVGDPGVSGRLLVGVTSFGSPVCGQPDTPTVFTKLGYYADWIQDIMDQEVPQYSHSTTTSRPFRQLDKFIVLYGLGQENAPIPIQREGLDISPAQDTAAVDADLQLVQSKLQKLGVPIEDSANLIEELRTRGPFKKVDILPTEEQDPEVKYSGPVTDNVPIRYLADSDKASDEKVSILREYDQDEEESTDYAILKTYAIEKDWSGSDSDGPTMNPVDRATQLMNVDTKEESREVLKTDVESREVRKTDVESREVRNTDVENDLRILKAPEIYYNLNLGLDVSGAQSPVRNSKELTSTKSGVNKVENIGKSTFKKHYQKKDKILRKKHLVPSLVDSELQDIKKPIEKQSKQNKKEVSDNINILSTSNIVQSKEEVKIDYADVNKQKYSFDEITSEQDHESTSSEKEIELHGHAATENQNYNADDIVKQEIQKLIEQLDLSSELNSETEVQKSINPIRNDLKADKDATRNSETVLTFLYMTDSEKKEKAYLRANDERRATDASGEGLSIDSAPFSGDMHRSKTNNLIGNSEIYEIFANVLNTVVNKTVE